MELPAPAAAIATTSPRPPIVPSKLRLMCSYSGHIVPRPHDKSLFYAGGETRIIAVDRCTTAASLSALSAYLSRALLSNRPFHLKYQLPGEDLDSLISVITDEDLFNMLDEHDRIDPPSRIRLFLFPVNPKSLGSTLLDPKSETWFSDALQSTGILQKGQSADSSLLMSIVSDLEAPVESGCIGGGGGKLSADSLVLEMSSSFGSTNSSFSMSNSPSIGINQGQEQRLNLLDRSIRVPAPSIESEISLASISAPPSKPGFLHEPLVQVDQDKSSEKPISKALLDIANRKPAQVIGYPISQLPDGKMQHPETQFIQGGLHYIPQYPGPGQIPPYYTLYQMPIHPQHISYTPNQPYPIYLVPTAPSQYPNMPLLYNTSDANTTTTTSVQTALLAQPGAVQMSELPEPQAPLEPLHPTASDGHELEEDIVYAQIYKTQPLPHVPTPQNETVTMGMGLVKPSVPVQQKKPC